MVNIVRIGGGRYMVDVGFGGNQPPRPLRLVEGQVSVGVAPEELRLVHTRVGQHRDPDQRVWVFQHRNDPGSPWRDAYCFAETEFFPDDFEVMNFKTSQARTSFFTYQIVCVKYIMGEANEHGEKAIVGAMILNGNEVKRRIAGKSEHVMTCGTEAERVAALKEYFDIDLSVEEQKGIKGMVTEIKGG